MIQQQLFTLLSGSTEAGARVFPLIAPDGVPRPYIVYQRVAAVTENVLSGDAGLTNTRIQIDTFGDTYAQAQTVAAAIIALMDGWSVQNVNLMSQDFFEPDTKLHRCSMDFSIWHSSA